MADVGLKFDTYTFPNVRPFSHTFGDMVPQTTRLPGVNGGHDQYGSEPAPGEIGQVRASFILVSSTREAMQALIDAVYALPALGKRKLYFRAQGETLWRWCYARVNNINLPRDFSKHTDLFQSGSITFQASEPHWYLDEASDSVTASGTQTNDTITPTGNDMVLPLITVSCGVGQTCQNPKIQRLVSSVVMDEVVWTGTLTAGQNLIINCRSKSVKRDTVDGYSAFDFEHPSWFRLASGANSVRVIFANAGDAATVLFTWFPTYR